MKDRITRKVKRRSFPHGDIDESRSPKRHQCERPAKKRVACILCSYNEKDVSYHRFPDDHTTRREWLGICELPEKTNTKCLRICDRHFTEDDKSHTFDGVIYLKEAAIPTLKLEVYGLKDDDKRIVSAPFLASNSQNTVGKYPVERVTSQITSSASCSELATTNDLKNNTNLKSRLGMELVEVVEMKIYRFNPSSTSDAPSSSDVTVPENGTTTSTEKPADESDVHIKGLEMHSYSKPPSAYARITSDVEPSSITPRKALRYFGDFTEADYKIPGMAKQCWLIACRLIEKKNQKILNFQEENEKLERRLKNLKELILQLRRTGSIPEKYRKRRKETRVKRNVIVSVDLAAGSRTDDECIVID